MRTFDEAFNASTDRAPFSSGAEGNAWADNWCSRCTHDGAFQRAGVGSGCPLLLVATLDKTPVEWIVQDERRLGDTYHCVEFRPERDGRDDDSPEPGPDPVIDGQVDVFEVWAEQITEQAADLAEAVTR